LVAFLRGQEEGERDNEDKIGPFAIRGSPANSHHMFNVYIPNYMNINSFTLVEPLRVMDIYEHIFGLHEVDFIPRNSTL